MAYMPSKSPVPSEDRDDKFLREVLQVEHTNLDENNEGSRDINVDMDACVFDYGLDPLQVVEAEV